MGRCQITIIYDIGAEIDESVEQSLKTRSSIDIIC